MAIPTPPNVVCTPFVGRTIKGWVVKVRICWTVTPAEAMTATFGETVAQNVAAVLPLINALSNASFVGVGGANLVQDLAYGLSTSETDNAEDAVELAFQTANGTVSRISVPAPLDSIFLADNQTVNPANGDVAALVTQLLQTASWSGNGVASTKSGAALVAFLGGVRVRRSTRRRMNIFVRNPELTAPGI